MKNNRNFYLKIASTVSTLSLFCSLGSSLSEGGTMTFGSGTDSFSLEFVTIGDAGNVADSAGKPNPAGSVAYEYQMGKYEVSRDMIIKANASGGLGLTLNDMSSRGGNGVNRPGTGLSWNEAARFVNWLNTSQGYQAAYNFTSGGVNDNIALWDSADAWQIGGENLFRHKDSHYWLPSMDEWYKAAFYDPASSSYRNYASLSGTLPAAVASGVSDNSAVYGQNASAGPSDISASGGLSAYGVMGMSGNVYEWEETSQDLTNSSGMGFRGVRGGDWATVDPEDLSSSERFFFYSSMEFDYIGFRVAGLSSSGVIPEPGSLTIFAGLGLIGLGYRRRRRSA